MTLEELKQTIDEHYEYIENLTVVQVKELLNTQSNQLAFRMVADQVCLNVSLLEQPEGGSKLCCDIYVRDQCGRLFCYDAPDAVVSLTDDMETELFRILDGYVQSNGLSYTEPNGTVLESHESVHKDLEVK